MGASECVFCRILGGEAPAVVVYEDEHVAAFLDIYPANPGHTLIVPRIHVERYEDLPPRYRRAMADAAALVASAVTRELGYDGYNLLLNNGKAAGQEIMHVHLHVIPQGGGQRCLVLGCRRGRPAPGELAEIGARIRSALGG